MKNDAKKPPKKLTPLRQHMLDWIRTGNVTRSVLPGRFSIGHFPHAKDTAAHQTMYWLLDEGYACAGTDDPSDYRTPYKLTSKGKAAHDRYYRRKKA